MAFQRECARCRRPYEAKRASSRFCSASCRTMAGNARKAGLPEAVQAPAPARPAVVVASSVSAAVRRQLEAAEAVDSPLGAIALALAARVDVAVSESGAATLAKELRATLVAALDGKVTVADPLDELRKRRERRERRAG